MVVLTGIELCAGVGMLGEGVRAALRFLGHEYRTVCYVEREAYAAAQLVALMESECLDAAPVWSDMLTFDSGEFRGKVDCVIAGFPCQDLSIAGRRAGLDGKRSGLFFRVCDIADDCGAQFLILENVSAIASATATAMDEAEELDERAASRVMGELADRGWDSEWITLSASSVGASHRRNRWFCFAWRMADAERPERGPQRVAGDRDGQRNDEEWQANGGTGIAEQALADTGRSSPRGRQHERGPSWVSTEHQFGCAAMGHAGLQHQQLQQRSVRSEHPPTDEAMDDTAGARCDGTRQRSNCDDGSGQCVSGEGCESVGHAECSRRAQARGRSGINSGRQSEPGCGDVADTSQQGRERREQRQTHIGNRGGAGSTWIN